jgi:hypothetical protein
MTAYLEAPQAISPYEKAAHELSSTGPQGAALLVYSAGGVHHCDGKNTLA